MGIDVECPENAFGEIPVKVTTEHDTEKKNEIKQKRENLRRASLDTLFTLRF